MAGALVLVMRSDKVAEWIARHKAPVFDHSEDAD